MTSRRLWMCCGPSILCGIDAAVTLICQPRLYWRSGYQFVQESNPLAKLLLEFHPAALPIASLAWIALFSAAILYFPAATARVLALVILVGHSLGVSTWLIREPWGWFWCLVVWALARYLFERFWDETRHKP